MIFPDDFSEDDLFVILKDEKMMAQYKWLLDFTYPHFKRLYFFDTPIFSQKKILKSWEFRHIEEGAFFLSYRLMRENFSEKILVAPSVLPWLSKEACEKVYTYQFVTNDNKKNIKNEELIIFDYFHEISSLKKVRKFLSHTLKNNKQYYVFPFMGGRFYSNSFIDIFETLSEFKNVKLINWDEVIQKITSKSVNITYKKNPLLIGTSYLEKLMALHGEPGDYRIEGELVKRLPFGNECHIEIFKPYTGDITKKVDYSDPLTKELLSYERELTLNDPWLKYLVDRQ